MSIKVLPTGGDKKHDWVVVWNVFYFHPYLGKGPCLTNVFLDGLKPPSRWSFPPVFRPNSLERTRRTRLMVKKRSFLLLSLHVFPSWFCQISKNHQQVSQTLDVAGVFTFPSKPRKLPSFLAKCSICLECLGMLSQSKFHSTLFLDLFKLIFDLYHGIQHRQTTI